MDEEEQLAVLLGMGFNEAVARRTLAVAGNLEDAIALLLADGEDCFEDEPARREAPPRPVRPLQFAEEETSAIKLYGTYVCSQCGYCKQLNSSSNFAFTLVRARPEDYEALLGLGFGLSGTWCYRPLSERSCCALYTIRLDAARFKESAANAKTRRKMANFLARGRTAPEAAPAAANHDAASRPKRHKQQPRQRVADDDPIAAALSAATLAALAASERLPPVQLPERIYVRRPVGAAQHYAVPLAPLCQLYRNNNGATGAAPAAGTVSARTVFDCIASKWEAGEYGGLAFDDAGYLVFRDDKLRGQDKKKGKDSPEAAGAQAVAPAGVSAAPAPSRQLVVGLEEASFSEEKFLLYRQYQTVVHKDNDVEERIFRKNYCDCPVMRMAARPGDHPFGLGLAHMTYRIDGVLVGCCALMFCPSSLVSVYFFWDTLNCKPGALGHYSQLCEIELAARYPNLRYYNLMFHCPTSAKMGYKTKLEGTEIMCPYTLRYQPYDTRVRELIEQHGYTRLEADPSVANVDFASDGDALFDVPVALRPGLVLPYGAARDFLQGNLERLEQRLEELCRHVGELRYRLIALIFEH